MSELTPMQAACWFGRKDNGQLGNVASHLYTEFDGENINIDKLNSALGSLYKRHEMLRLKVNHLGESSIIDVPNHALLEIEDFIHLSPENMHKALIEKRQSWAHQMLDLTQGQVARFSVSLLPDNAFRLHIDSDMIAIDPDSCRVLIEDLAMLYESGASEVKNNPTFFSWHGMAKNDPILKSQRKSDRAWWKSNFNNIAPSPSLPFFEPNTNKAESHHYSAWLDAEQRTDLITLARKNNLTPANLMLGLFARTLGKATGDETFRINVPTFWRPPIIEGTESLVGDFVNFVVLSVDMKESKTLLEFCHTVADKMGLLLGHSRYDGVSMMRDLSLHHGCTQLAPVVFTSAIDLPSGNLFSRRVHKHFGKMNWTISQGSHVALDSQVVSIDGGIMINWDVRQEALPKEWTSAMFENFVALTKSVISTPDLLVAPLDKLQPKLVCLSHFESELTPMQRAYLLGRTTQMPLGGVAMQETLEHRGTLSASSIRHRLSTMVVKYPCLRTFIDSKSLKLQVSQCPQVNLAHVDLRHLEKDKAEEELARFRYTYNHNMFDLDQPLWNVTTFSLSETDTYVFSRFDALILDARSIASLLVELFDEQAPYIPSFDFEPDHEHVQSARAKDEKYWLNKLATVEKSMCFPWHKPLKSISHSRYQRQSLKIEKETVKKLVRVAGKEGLYKNTLMMSVAMEALSSHVCNGQLCVAVPVLPMTSANYASQSSFIVTQWNAHQYDFLQRAKTLQVDTLEGLEHLAFSGVDLARVLFERCGPAPALPIVITNGLSWPVLSDDASMTLQRGLTQTPQVAMDIRFVAITGGSIMFSVDYASEAVADDLVKAILDRIDMILDHMVETSQYVVQSHKLLPIGRSRVVELVDRDPNESWDIDLTKRKIFDIYCQVIGKEKNNSDSDSLPFSQLGLRPSHLKQISIDLNKELQVDLPVMQLIRCRNADDVKDLALQQVVDF